MLAIFRKYWSLFVVGVLLLGALIFVVFRGQNIYIQVHDNLDSNVANYQVLKNDSLFFSHNAVLGVLGGLNRDCFPSEFKLYTLLYMVLPTFIAYIAGIFLRVVISIVGWVLLDKSISEHPHFNYAILSGFLYGCLPTFPTCSFGFASLPLLLYFLICAYRTKEPKYYILLLLYPSLSDFSVFGIFICGYILIFIIGDSLKNRKVCLSMCLALAVLCVGFMINEYRLFNTMLWGGEKSIRWEMINTSGKTYLDVFTIKFEDIKNLLIGSKEVFRDGHYHSGDLHKYLVYPVCIVYFIYVNVYYIIKKEPGMILKDTFNIFMIWAAFNAFIYSLDALYQFKLFVALCIAPLRGFSFARTLWFNPFVWYFSFHIVISRILDTKNRIGRSVSLFLYLGAFIILIMKSDIYNGIHRNIANIKHEICREEVTDLTYSEFYAEDLFNKIKSDIAYDGEWTMAVGFHPSVLYYNGFNTLDGYISYYGLAYKEKFRRIIAPSLEKDLAAKQYYDGWGGRAYVFTPGVPYEPGRHWYIESASLVISEESLREMNGKYIVSRVLFDNLQDYRISLIGTYTDDNTPYCLYVYQVL